MDKNDNQWLAYDFRHLIFELFADTKIIQAVLKVEKSHTWRCSYVRAVFAEIEATLSSLKKAIRRNQKFGYLPLSKEDQRKLDEHFIRIAKNGKPLKRVFYLSFLENVAFTFNMFARSSYISYKVDKSSDEWRRLRTASTIRNRITHPKSSGDIFISATELRIVQQTDRWFQRTVVSLMQKGARGLARQTKLMQKPSARLTTRSS